MRKNVPLRFAWFGILGVAILAVFFGACGDGPNKRAAKAQKTTRPASLTRPDPTSVATDLSVRDRGTRRTTARWQKSSMGSER